MRILLAYWLVYYAPQPTGTLAKIIDRTDKLLFQLDMEAGGALGWLFKRPPTPLKISPREFL